MQSQWSWPDRLPLYPSCRSYSTRKHATHKHYAIQLRDGRAALRLEAVAAATVAQLCLLTLPFVP